MPGLRLAQVIRMANLFLRLLTSEPDKHAWVRMIFKGGAKKVSGHSLAAPRLEYRSRAFADSHNAQYRLMVGHQQFDMLWCPKPGSMRLFVFLCGDIQRAKTPPPVFSRWSWADNFPGHCLYIFDPTVYALPLTLAWYCGTSDFDPAYTVARIVNDVCQSKDIQEENVFLYGSSGGGFAALRFSLFFPGSVPIAINPQIDITTFHLPSADGYLRKAFGLTREEARKRIPERVNLFAHIDAFRRRRIIYAQNLLDPEHYENHYLPFCAALKACKSYNTDQDLFHRVTFSHPGGHAAGETSEVARQMVGIAEAWTFKLEGTTTQTSSNLMLTD